MLRKTAILSLIILICGSSLYATQLELKTHAYSFNNADLQNYDKDKYQELQSSSYNDTDDRTSFMYSELNLIYDRKYKHTEFFTDVYFVAYWGADNHEGSDNNGNPLMFKKLYFNYYASPDFTVSFGRFEYEIGDSEKDYFFHDLIDGIMLNYKFSENFKINFEADIMGIGSRPYDSQTTFASTSWDYLNKDEEEIKDFDGDVIAFRTGGSITVPFAKFFGYALRYGASNEGGADISENGKNATNKADGDYLGIGGARLFSKETFFGKIDFTSVYSYGKDFQYGKTLTYNGYGGALNYLYTFDNSFLKKIFFSGGYFDPGFCSLKGDSMGEMLLYNYKKYYISPYAGFYHFQDYEKNQVVSTPYIDKTVSKTFAKLSIDLELAEYTFIFNTLALFANEKEFQPEYMGTENQIEILKEVENITLSMVAAVFIPSNYYEERSSDNQYMPKDNDPFYGFNFNVTYYMDWI